MAKKASPAQMAAREKFAKMIKAKAAKKDSKTSNGSMKTKSKGK